jgi:hypothetical protein
MATIKEINEFAEEQIAELLVEIQKQRFKNQGKFLDHEKWENNPKHIAYEKFYRKPLIQTGELKKEMTSITNWGKEVKKQQSGLQTKFSIPTTENFSDPKYNKQDIGETGGQWKGLRTGKDMSVKNVKKRPFKDTSKTDIAWVKQQLTQRIQAKFANG